MYCIGMISVVNGPKVTVPNSTQNVNLNLLSVINNAIGITHQINKPEQNRLVQQQMMQ